MMNFIFDLQRFAFSGGNGTSGNPYKISTAADLEQLARDVNGGNEYNGVHFKVTNDIALSGNWRGIGGFYGGQYRTFKGIFDGRGYTISGLTTRPGDQYSGLFGHTSYAKISNVNLTDVDLMVRDQYVGAIAGAGFGTEITNCKVQGKIETGVLAIAGGIIGYSGSWGKITNCAYIGTIKRNSNESNVGIIAGSLSLRETLAGNCYYGDLGHIYSGGATKLYDCTVPQGVTFDETFTFGDKTYIKEGNVTFKFMDNTYKYNVKSNVTVTIKDNKFFVNDTDLGSAVPAFEGNGSKNNPYLIKTEEQLRQLAAYVNYGNDCKDLYFKLAKDINLTGEWTPIGGIFRRFSGKFDGDGHTINNLTLNGDINRGLFGVVNGATIQNVHLTNVNVTGERNVGALVGQLADNAEIINCTAQGNVKATDDGASVGGLVGFTLYSAITGSAFLGGSITGIGKRQGVIVGDSLPSITDNNYYYGKLAEGVKDNDAKQIFRIAVPEGVTSTSIVTFNGIKYIQAGDAAFTYNGKTYNCTVTENLDVSVEGDNLSFGKLDTAENFLSTLDGNGTENNPYLIKNEAQLRRFANYVRYVDNCAGKNFKLTNDITLTKNFTPVGDNLTPFSGTFDGNGKNISNLTINGDANQGLFGKVNGATIKNVKLTNVDVTGKDNVGAVVGTAAGKTQISNCSAQGNVKGSANVGGLVGVNDDSTVKDSAYLGGTLTGTNKGAIVGNNGGTLDGNYYYGTLASGVSNNDAAQIFKADLPEGVTSSALVEINGAKYIKAGSVILNRGHKNYSVNVTGDITVTLDGNKFFVNDTEYVAEFFGTLDGEGTEDNPYLIKTADNLSRLATYVNKGNNCAGANFKLANNIALTGTWTPIGNSSNKFSGTFDGDGKIISNLMIDNNDEEGSMGLFGCVDNATIKNVKLTDVNIICKARVGALVGKADNNSQILNCSASGNIKTKYFCSFVGGLVGQSSNGGTIDGCTFSGNLEGLKVPGSFSFLGSHIGGIVGGYTDGGTVKNCAYLGGAIKSSDGGAITARTMKCENFTNNYYYGKLEEGIADSGATQIFKATLPEGVTSSSLVTFNGTTYIKAGNATLTYDGQNYSHNVSADLTVTLQDDKLSFVDEQSTAAQGLKLHASDNGQTLTGGAGNDSLWGGLGSDTFIHNGGHDIIYGFGNGDTLKVNGLDDITATYNAADNDIKIPCGTAGSVTLKDFTTNEFAINNDTWTLSGSTLTKK